MKLVPWQRKDVEHPLTSLQKEMNRVFENFFGGDWGVEPFRGVGDWSPAMDVMETDKSVIVKAEVPGMEAKDVEINLAGDLLTIKGEKKEEKEEKAKNVHRVERAYGYFERTVRLPAPVKSDEAEATHKDGVLTITLPKTEQARVKTVKVKVEK